MIANNPASVEIRLTYVPTIDDYVEYIRRIVERDSKWQPRKLIIGFALIVGLAMLYDALGRPGPALAGVFVGLLVLAAFLLLIALLRILGSHLLRRNAKRKFRDHNFATRFFLPKTFEASTESVRLFDEISDLSQKWPCIEEVEMTKHAIYLHGEPLTYVLPAHAFSDDATFRLAAHRLREWLTGHDRSQGDGVG